VRDRSPQAARWRVLEGRPFEQRLRLAVLAPALPNGDANRLESLRETAREFDLILFAFADRAEADCTPLLDFCARVILVEPPPRRRRSELMQTLWDGFSREFAADLRQVDGAGLAPYGGDLLIADAAEPAGRWGRWRRQWVEERAFRSFRRVLRNGNTDPGMRAQLYRDLIDRVVVRPAAAQDVPALDRIQRLSPGAVLWEPASYLSYDCRVAEVEGRVAGFVVCRALAGTESEVLSLVVDPDARRRGIGTRLMRAVLGEAPQTTWYLEVRESNWPARNLYRKLGFQDVASRVNYYQDSGETAVVMRRQS
jgi:ribosomal-protein-alanine acetyltransferase